MRAEILSIGTELLIGSINNTNARFLADKLATEAIDVYYQVTVGDNTERLNACLETAAQRADIIITSGGLGPTQDDVTLKSLLAFTQKKAILHKPTYRHIHQRLASLGYRMTNLAKRQCFVPQGSVVFRNNNGAAPGILCHVNRAGKTVWLLALPGPPRELEPMLTSQALPELLKKLRIKRENFVIRDIKITGLTETQVAQKSTDLLKSKPPLTTGIYAKPGLVTLKIMAKFSSARLANSMADRVEKSIRARLGTRVFGVNNQTLSSVTGDLLRKNKKTLSVAESCTGGLLGTLITDTPGSSSYFSGGIIAYNNRVKIRELGVKKEVLDQYGAVSSRVASAMARGVRMKFGSDLGVGITGIAGPQGASKEKPVGLVFIAVASAAGVYIEKNIFRGNRSDIRSRAAHKALDMVRLSFAREAEVKRDLRRS